MFRRGNILASQWCLLKCDKGRVYIWQRPCLLKCNNGRVYIWQRLCLYKCDGG